MALSVEANTSLFIERIVTYLSDHTACDVFPITEDIDRYTDLIKELDRIIRMDNNLMAILASVDVSKKEKPIVKDLVMDFRKTAADSGCSIGGTFLKMANAILNFDTCYPSEINALLGTFLESEKRHDSDNSDY